MKAAVCSAGRDHNALRQSPAWESLELVGIQHVAADETGPAETLELRNCACNSTLCRAVQVRVVPVEPEWSPYRDGLGEIQRRYEGVAS